MFDPERVPLITHLPFAFLRKPILTGSRNNQSQISAEMVSWCLCTFSVIYYCLVGLGYYGKQTSVKLDAKFRASFKWELYPFSAEVCQRKTDNTSHLHSTLTKIGMYVVLCWKDVLVTVLILVGQRWKLEEPFWEASSRGRTALWDYSWGPPNRVVAGQVVIFAL